MAGVHVLCPTHPNDPVSARSAWIAEQHRSRLGAEVRTGTACTERALRGEPPPDQGSVYVGHGYLDHIVGSDEQPLFPGQHVARAEGRWFHAFACDAATVLGPRMSQAGVRPWVGYRGRLTPEWSEGELDPSFVPLAADAVTAVSAALAAGALTKLRVEAALVTALDRVEEWTFDPPDDSGAARFRELLVGLRRHLVFLPPSGAPRSPRSPHPHQNRANRSSRASPRSSASSA